MSDNKVKTELSVSDRTDRVYAPNGNGDMVNERGGLCGSYDCETGKVKITMSTKPPTNPNTSKPYFEIRDDAWNGEWVAGEVKLIPSSECGGDL